MPTFNRYISSFDMRFLSRAHEGPPAYPEVPGSLRSGSFDTSDLHKLQEARANSAPYITPYLGLRSRLSQIWINRWTILLLLVLVRVLLLIAQLNDNVGDAETQALSACTKVEDVGSSMASMPHYLSVGVNDMASSGIESAVKAMVYTIDLMLEGIEGLIFFFINFLVGTYVCLLNALVKGSLDAVADVTEEAGKAINTLIDKVTGEIDDISGSLQSGINDALEGINNLFRPGSDAPEVDFSGPIKDLQDFNLDADDFAKSIRNLNDKIPDFDEVKNLTQEAISIPFDFVRQALNESYGDYQFDRDVFPLAQKEKMTFCSDNNTLNDFFQGLFSLINTARTVFIVVLVILAVGVMAPMAWFEIKRWRLQQKYVRLAEGNSFDTMDIAYISTRPTTASWGIRLGSRFTGKRQILVRWCVAYATSPPAIFVLSLAVAGLFSCACQAILLRTVQGAVPALTQQVGEFADNVVTSLSAVSEQWASDANGVITDLNDDINDDVLGYVRNATDAVNDTLTTFTETMDDGLNDVFKGTPLLGPIKTVVRCVIGIKIEGVQKGLTWVNEHANVTLPRFSDDLFSAGAKDSVNGDSDLSSFLASPSAVTTDEVSGAVQKVVDWLYNNIVTEALISMGVLLVYIIVVLMGVARTLAGMAAADKTRAEGGPMHFTGDGRPPLTPRSPPQAWQGDGKAASHSYGNDAYVHGGSGNEKMVGDLGARPRHNMGQARSSSYDEITPARKF